MLSLSISLSTPQPGEWLTKLPMIPPCTPSSSEKELNFHVRACSQVCTWELLSLLAAAPGIEAKLYLHKTILNETSVIARVAPINACVHTDVEEEVWAAEDCLWLMEQPQRSSGGMEAWRRRRWISIHRLLRVICLSIITRRLLTPGSLVSSV